MPARDDGRLTANEETPMSIETAPTDVAAPDTGSGDLLALVVPLLAELGEQHGPVIARE